ncbi:hypothetical protein E4U59_000282 [Claviceps monticola]|nr:hypothetical protein E4U59_000282 [Claviceps monticola]
MDSHMENGCPPAALQQILNQLQVFQDQILRLERERAAAAINHENQIGALQQQVANLAAGLRSFTPSHIPTHNDHSALGPLNALAIVNDDDPSSAPEDHEESGQTFLSAPQPHEGIGEA